MYFGNPFLASGQWFPAVPRLNSWVLRSVVLSLSSKLLRTIVDRCGGHIGPWITSPRSLLWCERATSRQSEATPCMTDAARRRTDVYHRTPIALKISSVSLSHKDRTNDASTCGVQPHVGARGSRALDGRQTVGARGCDLNLL